MFLLFLCWNGESSVTSLLFSSPVSTLSTRAELVVWMCTLLKVSQMCRSGYKRPQLMGLRSQLEKKKSIESYIKWKSKMLLSAFLKLSIITDLRKRAPNSKQESFYSFLFLFLKIAFLGYFKKTWQHSLSHPFTTLHGLLYTCGNICFSTILKIQKTIYSPAY